ncbi:dual adapter for phosphotyrosine and 3-phosphotyrosine and 3-phosphoinositide-like [Actinia tenebrosa]|uniref:Dual adapter for phosphotyrosine and 3-phosphotyrosine and 3-phosphoinositide-like n=1 Tax=Actinia tenebrosa TaxID=6105 RepID=A0A6P8ID10_ACTTE|nr:dual adapter for phosphotyrosine and 3-phosphotyrosine and 3-phosphoinositide-like [Actinia tenebrosa]
MSSARPTKEGHLRKYRNIFLGWAKRYFRLERSYLHYFEAPYAPEPLGSITRGDIADVNECNQFQGKTNVFELHTKSGVVWFLQADSSEEMYSWMKVLVPTKDLPSSQDQVSPSGFVVVSDNSPQPTQILQYPGGSPQWQGLPGPYNPPPMQPGQVGPQFDPRMFATGGPLYDPRVHGQVPYTPPPPYTEETQPAQPLPSKTGLN